MQRGGMVVPSGREGELAGGTLSSRGKPFLVTWRGCSHVDTVPVQWELTPYLPSPGPAINLLRLLPFPLGLTGLLGKSRAAPEDPEPHPVLTLCGALLSFRSFAQK